MDELHLTKKDFEIQWYSGTGAGGQHRNKHQNCCRIIHTETGLRAQSSSYKDRPSNQRDAFNKLAEMIIAHYFPNTDSVRRTNDSRIRTYHEVRNEVHDHASGLKQPYKKVVVDNDIGDMIKARKENKWHN